MPTFTQDWFSHNIPGMKQVLAKLPARKRFLEVGCFEGLATCWFLAHYLDDDGTMVCVDTFKGGADHVVTRFEGVEERFRANVEEARRPGQEIVLLDTFSHLALGKLLAEGNEERFDFIYIDGSHLAADVMADACMAYHLLKVGGVMVFDDYLFGADRPILDTPKLAVDLFTTLFRDRVGVVMMGYQLAVKREK